MGKCFNCGKQLSFREMDRKHNQDIDTPDYCDWCIDDMMKEREAEENFAKENGYLQDI